MAWWDNGFRDFVRWACCYTAREGLRRRCRISSQAEHLPYQSVRAFHETSENEHVKQELAYVLPCHRDGGQVGVNRRCSTGGKGGIDETGQNDDGPFHAHTGIALYKGLSYAGGRFAGESGQGKRRDSRVKVQLKKAAVYREDKDKGHDRDKQCSQKRHEPEGDALHEADFLNGGDDFFRERGCFCDGAAHAPHGGGDGAAADGEDGSHDLHAIANGDFGSGEADEVA